MRLLRLLALQQMHEAWLRRLPQWLRLLLPE
jgi:hypothetical protein